MKNVFNWFFGSFFRALGRFLSFLIVLFVLALILSKLNIDFTNFLFIDNVYAESGSYESSTYAYYHTNCNNQGENCILSNKSSYSSMGTISNPSAQYPIGGISVRAYAPSDDVFIKGNSYTYKWRVCESSKWQYGDTLSKLRNNSRVVQVEYSATNSASNPTIGDTSAVGLSITDDNSSNYCWYMSLIYTPQINSRYMGFIVSFNGMTSLNEVASDGLTYSGIYTGNDFRTNGLTITYQVDPVGVAIDNQTTIINNNQQEINNSINQTNDILNDDNVDSATNEAEDFFSGFSTDTFGLTSIITAPLNLIGSITSSSCSPLGIPLPYVNKNLQLPCLSTIYRQYFGSFFTIYQTITFGIVAYWVLVRIFNLVKDFKNPEHDEIEVLDL